MYETGTASSIEDLIDKLQTFLDTDPAWTIDNFSTGDNECTIHLGDLYVSFAWDASPSTDLAIYQSLGYSGIADIWDMTDDSGNGDTSPSTVNAGRRVNFGSAGPYTAYHFFAADDAPYYCHVAVEVSSGVFRHFGFGTIIKVNDWTGGEYAYGHFLNQAASAIDDPTNTAHTFLLDSTNNDASIAATMHIEGVGNMGGSSKWGCFNASPGTDRAAVARAILFGGARAGYWLRYMGQIRNSVLNAYVPIIPIPVVYRDTAPTPDLMIWLGQMRDIGIVNIANLSPGDEITVGADTWIVFPWVRKQYLLANTEESWNAGVAYKKLV